MSKIALCAALFVALSDPTWAVNKCTIDGKTVYQDAPCPGAGAAMNLPKSAPLTAEQTAKAQQDINKLKHDNAIAEGIRTNKPVIGMTRSQLDQAMGLPNAVNAGNYGGTLKDQLVYYKPNGTWYVYTTNGTVESIQASAPMPQSAGQSSGQTLSRCPTTLEIRNVEITADNLNTTAQDRRAILKRVADMRACKSM